MNSIVSTRTVLGWTVGDAGDGKPRMLDEELGRRLGLKRAANIKNLVAKYKRAGFINPFVVFCASKKTGGRPSTQNWLDEGDALFVAAKSGADLGNVVLRQMVDVYVAVRHGRFGSRGTRLMEEFSVVLDAARANPGLLREGATLGDYERFVVHARGLIGELAERDGVSWQKIHGEVRRLLGFVSYLRLGLAQYPLLIGHLEDRLRPPAPHKPPTPSPQLGLFGRAA